MLDGAYAVRDTEKSQEVRESKDGFLIDFDPREHNALEYGLSTTEPTVLVVEDEMIIRDLLVEVLQDRGFLTFEADDIEQAKKMLSDRSVRIDILVSDIRLPGGDGRDLAKSARATRPDLKVLFVSGYANPPYEAQIDQSTDFMRKPFGMDEMAEHVEALLP